MSIAVASTKESLAATYAGLATHASVHTADPGTTGASEATGGSPAYARKAIVWNAGGSDGVYTSDPIDFDVPAGTYTHLGTWSASSGGTFRDKTTISASYTGQGILRATLTYTQS